MIWKVIFGIIYLLWAITMFIDFQLGISLVVLSLSLYWAISAKETSKFQKELLSKIDSITEITKSLKEHYEGENKTWQTNSNNIFKIILPWIKTSTSDNKTWEK